jgi:hypothetical protein
MVVIKQIFNDFKPLAIVLPHNRPRLAEGQMLEKEVVGNNKIVEMFQAMAIMSMKMGNLGLEVQSLKTRLAIMEGKNKDC